MMRRSPAVQQNHTRRALVSVAGAWEFQNVTLRCSLSVALTAVHNASIWLKSCSLGGLGEAAGTPEAQEYGAVLEMETRHRECVARAEACEADADAWHKRAMFDPEMEAKLADLQDPTFLVSTPMAAMQEADALMRQCTDGNCLETAIAIVLVLVRVAAIVTVIAVAIGVVIVVVVVIVI